MISSCNWSMTLWKNFTFYCPLFALLGNSGHTQKWQISFLSVHYLKNQVKVRILNMINTHFWPYLLFKPWKKRKFPIFRTHLLLKKWSPTLHCISQCYILINFIRKIGIQNETIKDPFQMTFEHFKQIIIGTF